MAAALHCVDFEAALSDFQDGALPPETAAAMREHLRQCPACAELSALLRVARAGLAELAPVEPPPGWMDMVLARTSRQRRWISWAETCRALGRGFWQPRLAMTFGVVLFAFALGLNVAGVNLRHADWRQWSPGQLVHDARLRLGSSVARGSRYYNDLKLVYEIQAALRQSARRNSAPPGPERRNQSNWPGGGARLWSWNAPPPSAEFGRSRGGGGRPLRIVEALLLRPTGASRLERLSGPGGNLKRPL